MLNAVSTAIDTVITWVGKVITALTGETGALAPLLPLLAVGVAISALMFGFMAIRKCIWGA